MVRRRFKKMPQSMRERWEKKKITNTILVFMQYWKMDWEGVMKTPIPAYMRMMEYMEKDLKEREKQAKKAKKGKKGARR